MSEPFEGDNDGGFNSVNLCGYALWGMCYGVGSAIALKTIDNLTCRRMEQRIEDTVWWPAAAASAQREIKDEMDKTSPSSSHNPSVRNVVSPDSVIIINPREISIIRGTSEIPQDQDQERKSSSSTSGSSSKGFVKGTCGAAIDRTRRFFSRTPRKGHPILCKHIDYLYKDCLLDKDNRCESYLKLMKKCLQMDGDNVSATPTAPAYPMIRIPFHLLLMSYQGCRQESLGVKLVDCSHYVKYMEETSQD